MVEQGTHKPLDVGSNPTLATLFPLWLPQISIDIFLKYFVFFRFVAPIRGWRGDESGNCKISGRYLGLVL